MHQSAEEKDDAIVEEYLRGNTMTRQVIRDTLTAFPIPRWKFVLAITWPVVTIGLWGVLHYLIYMLVKAGVIVMSPILWIMDILVTATVITGTIGFRYAYASNKADIERMIAFYSIRHPDSELINQYYTEKGLR